MKKTNTHIFNKRKDRIHQLRAFYYTARLRSMSQAAKFMGVTQSAITQQIKALESDLNIKLFQRESRPLYLSEEGQDLYKAVAPTLGDFDSIIDDFLERKNKRQILVAAHHVAISYIMPQVINEFRKIDPDTKILFCNIPPSEAIERLKNRKIDLAFYPFYQQDRELKYIEISRYKPVLIINRLNPMANQEIDSLEDLKKYDFIRIDKKLITLPFFEEAINNYNISGTIEFENGNWEMLINMVKENDFVAIVSDLCVNKNVKDGLIVKDLSRFFPDMKYGIAYNGNHHIKTNVRNFIDSIKKYAEK